MPETNRPLKVFLSYASQDKPLVRELSSRLVGEGWIDTWQDEKNLLPGQDWRVKIEEAVEEADVVIIILSQHSVSKEGHVQKELRYAREIALEKPEDTIFLIPLRLDECEVPRGLRFYQWVDYFDDKKDISYKALVTSLNLRYDQKLETEKEERLHREQQEREKAEKVAREKAEKDAAEKARLRVEEEERQRISKEEAEHEATEKKAKEFAYLKAEEEELQKVVENAKRQSAEKVKKEASKKDYLKIEKDEWQKVTGKKPKVEELEKNARKTKNLLAEEMQRDSKEKSWTGVFEGEEIKPAPVKLKIESRIVYWFSGVVFIFGIMIFSFLNIPLVSPEATLDQNTPQVVFTLTYAETNIASKTPSPAKTNTLFLTPTNTSTPTPELTIGSTLVSDKDEMIMVYVPAGTFIMGSNNSVDEQPIHDVDISSFWIDSTEVTNKMYAKCVDANACDLPLNFSSYYHDNYYDSFVFENYPVINVNWFMAMTYCEWAGRSLPTEAQWEKAARGTDGRTYPWGEGLSCDKVDFFNGTRSCRQAYSVVRDYPYGVSPYGAYDMAGNVSEWVNSIYKLYPYSPTDGREDMNASGERVFRGGSGYYFSTNLRSSNRSRDIATSAVEDRGFRCALNINP